ncbi:hypothetical protein BDR07DRAFT_126693 [Suillus spraguei]|nr:hypothetical protein BDR07DRAFT_126693 [Suillus spraguei]
MPYIAGTNFHSSTSRVGVTLVVPTTAGLELHYLYYFYRNNHAKSSCSHNVHFVLQLGSDSMIRKLMSPAVGTTDIILLMLNVALYTARHLRDCQIKSIFSVRTKCPWHWDLDHDTYGHVRFRIT